MTRVFPSNIQRRALDPCLRRILPLSVTLAICIGLGMMTSHRVAAHVVPPEQLHPVAESYRRMIFMLNLNPILWEEVRSDCLRIMREFEKVDARESQRCQARMDALIREITRQDRPAADPPELVERKAAAREIFEMCTRSVGELLVTYLKAADESIKDYSGAWQSLITARQLWASFEHEVKFTDQSAFTEIGLSWLELTGAMGHPGVLKVGGISADPEAFRRASEKIIVYINHNFVQDFVSPQGGSLAPLPVKSETFNASAVLPVKLPPGADLNKQLPRPRQILNIGARGVNESETVLIALGDMAFDSPYIFGEPARSLGISCNTCHNKSITNPNFMIPGLSSRGGMDVSNSFFAPHANNGHFDPLDIPDLRGIRFLAPYGRNGRFASLREFVRNVIVNEFNGPEPDPVLLDGVIAYMNEFDFLPNPYLDGEGRLNDKASERAKRGEAIFNKPFKGMGDRSCTTCHIPSGNFIDRLSHDVGSVDGTGEYSRDRTLDTPTLLGIKYTPPYFHDGRFNTLGQVIEYFNKQYNLALHQEDIDALTAYVETVGDGTQAYEDTMFTLGAEMEEFSFFLSAYEFLKGANKPDLINATLQTIALEIDAHKWDVQDQRYLAILNQLAELMGGAYEAHLRGERETTDAKVAEYRRLYEGNANTLK